MRAILDEATDPWGIKVNRVEVKNIIPPRDIQEGAKSFTISFNVTLFDIVSTNGILKCNPFFHVV